MAAAYGLYTHIQSNRRRSIVLLFGLFFLVYVMVFAGALIAESIIQDASLHWLLQKAFADLIWASPYATLGTAGWIAIAYACNQSLIDAVTDSAEVTRAERPPARPRRWSSSRWRPSSSRARRMRAAST